MCRSNVVKLACAFILGFVIMGSSFIVNKEPIPEPEWRNVNYNAPIPIKDTLSAVQLGSLLFHKGCEKCHNVTKAGFSLEKNPIGLGGVFDVMYSKLKPDHFVDIATVRTPAIVCSDENLNALLGGELGRGGLNENVSVEKLLAFKGQHLITADGVYTQVSVAFDAHSMASVASEADKDPILVDLANKAVGVNRISENLAGVFIGMYEKTIRPTESKMSKYRNFENVEIYQEGFDVFKRKCASCHGHYGEGHKKVALKVGESDFEGRIRLTGDEKDRNMLKVPPLYNLQDAPCYFHNCQDVSLYKAVKLCAETHEVITSAKERRALAKFLKRDLHDPSLERYLNFVK